jgi:hypothetical protein
VLKNLLARPGVQKTVISTLDLTNKEVGRKIITKPNKNTVDIKSTSKMNDSITIIITEPQTLDILIMVIVKVLLPIFIFA